MMKTNPLGAALTLTLALAALGTAWLFFSYLQFSKSLQLLQEEVLQINRYQARAQGLATEAVEYQQTGPHD